MGGAEDRTLFFAAPPGRLERHAHRRRNDAIVGRRLIQRFLGAVRKGAGTPQNSRRNRRAETPVEDFERWKTTLETVVDVGAFQSADRNLIAPDAQPEPVTIAEMSAPGFGWRGFHRCSGGRCSREDERLGAPPVLVIGYEVWRTRFAADPEIIGRQVSLSGTLHTVVGVMPEGFAFPVNHRYWKPLQALPGERLRTTNGEGAVFARLAPEATRDRAQLELSTDGLIDAPEEPDRVERLLPRLVP
jgi:putative ABC transport system permease protein